MRSLVPVVSALSILLLACGESTPVDNTDAGTPSDAGTDAFEPFDGGPSPDANVGDPDAGADPDVGVLDAAPPDPDAGTPDAGDMDAGPLTAEACFAAQFVTPPEIGPEYDVFMPTIGTHCKGTNHQDITGVERVVFLGDSVTVGTPPARATDFYRVQLANQLAERFDLDKNAGVLHGFQYERWSNVDVFDGISTTRNAGDFSSCARWGARADDMLRDGTQIEDCFPVMERDRRTLVVMTMGGNDVSNLTSGMKDGETIEDLWLQAQEAVDLFEDGIEWLKEPGRFSNGVFVVFANIYEFTDGTGDLTSCPGAELAGWGDPLPDPEAMAEIVIWLNEQFMRIAVETGTDMTFMLEAFCGHGFNADDPSAPCYRGPGAETWFDLTCIHPNATGHDAITDLFMSVVEE